MGEIPVGVIRSGLVDRWVAKSIIGKGWKGLDEAERERVVEIISQSNRAASRVSWCHISRTLKTSNNFSEEAKTISTPVLYFYEGDSHYHDMAKENEAFLKPYLLKAEVVLILSGIHDLQLQKPTEVAGLILEFFGRNNFGREDFTGHNPSLTR